MRKLTMVVAAVAALAVPAASQAQVSLGLRLGFAPAMGEVTDGSDLKDGIKSQVPVQLDALFQVAPKLSLGGYLGYGFGQTGKAFEEVCDTSGIDCSISVVRLGLQGVYAFDAVGALSPWAGVGFGYEWASFEAKSGSEKARFGMNGFELLNVQLGGDYRLSPNFSVGPFAMLSVGQYRRASEDFGDGEVSGSITEKGVHQWFQFGVRGSFDL